MTLLIVYIAVALLFSFLCSIAEAVLLSVTTPYVALQEKRHPRTGKILRALKQDINRPLAAILTLNTIAHTVGAAGAGAQAAAVFGNAWVGLVSAILTLLILVFSEIIPKTLGAHYWKALAPATAYGLRYLVLSLYPFVLLSVRLTGKLTDETTLTGFSREEFLVMADLSAREGRLAPQESRILKNLLLLRRNPVRDAMTPRTVVFSLPASMRVQAWFQRYHKSRFSRIPIYESAPDQVSGFVLKDDILLAQARGNGDMTLGHYQRDMLVLPEFLSLSRAFGELLRQRHHLALVVNEYGDMEGIITVEDIVETMLGLEIVDEGDRDTDMQRLARKLRQKRAQELGFADTADASSADGEARQPPGPPA